MYKIHIKYIPTNLLNAVLYNNLTGLTEKEISLVTAFRNVYTVLFKSGFKEDRTVQEFNVYMVPCTMCICAYNKKGV